MSVDPTSAAPLLLTKGAVPAPLHPQEGERLARLRDYEILDTEPEAAFNDLIALASYVTETPLGAISFVDHERQWFKATYGFQDKQTDRSIAFCAHAILETGPSFIVPDAAADERFSGNPLVTGPPHIRFYAGIPMRTPDGLPLGSFCVMDRTARELTPQQIEMLQHIARIAMDVVDSERHAAVLEKHTIFGPTADGGLPGAISSLAANTGPLHGLIDNLVGLYGPLLGGVHARIQRFRGEFPLEAFYLPEDPPSEAHEHLWQATDHLLHPTAQTLRRGTVEVDGARYLYGFVPVGFAGRVLARVDFISPLRENPCFENIFKLLLSGFLSMAEREIHTQELRFQTHHDPLTGLGNRAPLIVELDRSIRRADPDCPTDSLVHLRLDGLAEINDNFGYTVGDRVLVAAADRLRQLQDGAPFVSRIGGDKFLVLLHGRGHTGSLDDLLAALAAGLDQPFRVDGETVTLHASIGCALIDDPTLHPVEILRRADVAMREAACEENRTGASIFVYQDSMFRERQQRHQTNLLVRQAYEEKRFFLLFQPVIDLEHGGLGGAEGLLRMRGRDGTVVPAAEFMSAITRIRYQSIIDERVFGEFLRLCTDDGPGRELLEMEGFSLGLNATPAFLSTPGLAGRWIERLGHARLLANTMVIEIVENPLLLQNETLLHNLRDLRAAGVRIAIDDFGSGYSNLRHLTKLPIDIVKLDRSFLNERGEPGGRGETLMINTINLCRDLGYLPLVEGVETAEQDAFLRRTNCRYAQGFFYANPMTLEEVLVLARKFTTAS
jgi:diguanylate cyclase (GGDEF)-like protein